MIVIEGMDNSGKSTLAKGMAAYMKLVVQESEGPPLIEPMHDPTGEIEINERVDRYQAMEGRLFVRHPVVSNAIYGKFREEGNPITLDRTALFYESRPVLIYCDAGERGFEGHELKAHDTERHQNLLMRRKDELLTAYRLWAAQYATFVYRIGDDMERLIHTVHFFNQA